MKTRCTKDQLHLTLDRNEALALMSVLGIFHGETARRVPWYDQIANAMEAPGGMLGEMHTISYAIERTNLPRQVTVHPTYIA